MAGWENTTGYFAFQQCTTVSLHKPTPTLKRCPLVANSTFLWLDRLDTADAMSVGELFVTPIPSPRR